MDIRKRQMFEQYYQQHYKQIYDYIYRHVLNAHTAEDLAMDSFFAAFQKLETFDPEKASFGTWLYVIVNNKLKNCYRDKKISVDIDDCVIPLESFEDSVIAAEYLTGMRKALADALEVLPEKQQEIVVMRYFKNLNSTEIAEQLGMTAGNVRVTLNRSMAKLKEYFEAHNIRWEY
ncbi:MAG: sigma-70 family RNA polymerase sigma factor [Oscillospiraceae bacterium]|nr:sigma-70 family RNA polymerase sigma factor [Oscillospiraceae bacterium]